MQWKRLLELGHEPTPDEFQTCASVLADVEQRFSQVAMIAAAVALAEKNAAERVEESKRLIAPQLQDLETAKQQARQQVDAWLEEVSARGAETVARIKKEAKDEILKDAQEQFRSAQKRLSWIGTAWACVSAVALAAFFWFAFGILITQHLPDDWTWQLAYYAGVRVVILAGIGAVASFALRMLKAHIHLSHVNAHRIRIANSMPALLEVAPKEHQFSVLKLLIETLVTERDTTIFDANPEKIGGSVNLVELVRGKSSDD